MAEEIDIQRIFLEEETNQLRKIQQDAGEFEHYPKHREWLDKAIKEIHEGKKVGFGAFKYYSKKGRPSRDLIGSTIIKRSSEIKPIVELKNLYMLTDERGKKYAKKLYKRTEKYCKKEGFEKIETEVPRNEINTVGFLHAMGFSVTDMQTSPYKKGEYIYTMSKNITKLYNGDVFDFLEKSLWILSNYYGYTYKQDKEVGIYTFSLLENKEKVSDEEFEKMNIKGVAVVFDSEEEINASRVKNCFEKTTANLKLLFARFLSDDATEHARSNEIKFFDNSKLNIVFDSYFSYKNPPFNLSDIGGMICKLKPDFYKKIKESESFIYFKGGPMGKFLKPKQKFFFYIEESPSEEDRIYGHAEIKSIKTGNPQEVWESYKEKNPIFKEKDYKRFAHFKKNIIGIEVMNYQEFKYTEKINKETINCILKKGKHDTEDMGHLYINQNTVKELLDTQKNSKLLKGEDY